MRHYNLDPVRAHVAGDTVTLPFFVPDHDSDLADARIDLTNGTVVWALVDWDETVALSTANAGVSAEITDPIAGEFEIRIDAGTGDDLEGTYEQWVRVIPASGDRQTWIGEFHITEGDLLDELQVETSQ